MVFAAETVDLTKRFSKDVGYLSLLPGRRKGAAAALKGISLQVDPGEAFGLIGTNGAGKTTLLKVLASMILPNEGRAYVYGNDVERNPRDAKGDVGYVVTEERSFYWRLTGRQNLRFFGTMNNIPRRELDSRIGELAKQLDLTPALDTRVLYYSTGMRQKLAIGRAFLGSPKLLLMDEPTRSLDPMVAQGLRRFVKEELVRRRGRSIIIATHNLEEARQMCDRVAILHEGEVLACGPTERLLGPYGSSQQVTLNVEGLTEQNTERLDQIPGVQQVSTVRSVDGNGLSAFDIFLEEPKVQVPMVLESIYLAGGRVSLCQPKDVSLGDVLTKFVDGRSSDGV